MGLTKDEFDEEIESIESVELKELVEKILRRCLAETYDGSPENIESIIKKQSTGPIDRKDHNIEMLNFSLLKRTLRETRKPAYQVYSFMWMGLTVGHTCPFDLCFLDLYDSLEEAQKKIDEAATPSYVKLYNLKFKIPPHQKAYPMLFVGDNNLHTIKYHEFGDMFPEISENPQSKFTDNYIDNCIFYETQGIRTPVVKRISATKPLQELPELVREKVSKHLNGTGLDLKLLE